MKLIRGQDYSFEWAVFAGMPTTPATGTYDGKIGGMHKIIFASGNELFFSKKSALRNVKECVILFQVNIALEFDDQELAELRLSYPTITLTPVTPVNPQHLFYVVASGRKQDLIDMITQELSQQEQACCVNNFIPVATEIAPVLYKFELAFEFADQDLAQARLDYPDLQFAPVTPRNPTLSRYFATATGTKPALSKLIKENYDRAERAHLIAGLKPSAPVQAQPA